MKNKKHFQVFLKEFGEKSIFFYIQRMYNKTNADENNY